MSLSMNLESLFQFVLMVLIISNGILARAANAESKAKEGTLISFWILKPEQLTAKGKGYRWWFIANFSILIIVFFVWLVKYKLA